MSNEEIIAQLRAENQQLRSRLAACEEMLRERPLKVATMKITRTQPVASAAYMLWSQSVDALLAESGKAAGPDAIAHCKNLDPPRGVDHTGWEWTEGTELARAMTPIGE